MKTTRLLILYRLSLPSSRLPCGDRTRKHCDKPLKKRLHRSSGTGNGDRAGSSH